MKITRNTIVAPQSETAPAATPAKTQTPAPLSAEQEKALRKIVDAPPAAAAKEYDYVFIGAGATGGTAAANLADLFAQADELKKQGFSVLVLEGGVDKQTLSSQIPAAHGIASEDKKLLADPNRSGEGTGYNVRHFGDDTLAKQDPKADSNGNIFKPRGEGFGGSTRMNANVFVRIDDKDWDKIAIATGDPAFRAKNMKPLLQELTKTEYRPALKFLHAIGKTIGWDALKNLGGHGFDGPIELTRVNDPKIALADPQLAKVALRGMIWATTSLGSPLEKLKRLASVFDPNDDLAQNTEGAVIMPMSVNKEGRRNGARDILLKSAERNAERLTLQDGARVSKLHLDDSNKVTGLTYTDPDGKPHQITVKREAIVACGAMESAALLMRSGIGPKQELDKLQDVAPRVILDGVGKKQGFRYEVGVTVRMKEPFKTLQNLKLPPDPNDPMFKQWQAGLGGPMALNGAIFSYQARSRPDLEEPDLFVFAVPGRFNGYEHGYSEHVTDDPNLLTFVVLNKNKGEAKGTLELDPKNPTGAPLITHHFHSERKDGDSAPLVAGIKQVRELVAKQMADLVEKEVWPGGDKQSDEALKTIVEAQSWDHHPRGGAQIGHANDPNAVVDSDFKVLGTTGLRVIDASVLPDNIGDFIVSGLYQIGKLAAQKIASEAGAAPQKAQTFNPLSIRMAEPPKSLAQAEKTTEKAATDAIGAAFISEKQFTALTDGTVSQADMDLAWAAIDDVLARGEEKGSDKHTLAHNLLLAVAWQLDQQGKWSTRKETIKDRVLRFFRRTP